MKPLLAVPVDSKALFPVTSLVIKKSALVGAAPARLNDPLPLATTSEPLWYTYITKAAWAILGKASDASINANIAKIFLKFMIDLQN
ncbi:hypothetical protein [Limnohabitans sp. 2KL-51]|uniref:hypothetical protein n=1 Tax=Limnohabitans sp. 2KL-51 TaxID=1977911 RepID=UPI0018EE9F5C|nr:hypothetical protein [Limnohabitans sp. 2KL-51]